MAGKSVKQYYRRRQNSIDSPAAAIENGISFVTEDRKRFGLILEQTISNNMTVAALKRIGGEFLTSRMPESIAAQRSVKD